MRRRLLSLCAVLCMALVVMAEGKAKYVFYFIGDGMGVNQVNGTETYMAAVEGRIGTSPLCFAQFPYVGLVTTYSGTNGVTDSAAGGTALATGNKTKNGALGVKTDLTTRINSIAALAKSEGKAVGVTDFRQYTTRSPITAGGSSCPSSRIFLCPRKRPEHVSSNR